MQVEVFAIADAATDNQGKLNILGAFDTIWTQVVPALHPACSVALRFRFLPSDGAHHVVEIHIVDDFHVDIMPPIPIEMNIAFPEGAQSAATNFVANIQGLQLRRFAQHEVRLLVNGTLKMTIPLIVRTSPVSPQIAR